MIYITETKPLKLSGLTSFLVKFDYNEELVNVIKTFSPAIWHKNILSWEIQSSHLSKLLDTLTYYDEITFSLLPDEQNEIREISDPAWLKKFIAQK